MRKLFFSQAILAALIFSSVVTFAQNNSPEFFLTWGTCGNGIGQFQAPASLIINSSGNLMVLDVNNTRVQTFAPDSVFVSMFGERGTGDGQFYAPLGCVRDGNFLYISDNWNKSVQKFTENGEFIRKFVPPAGFSEPLGVAISENILYVVDRGTDNKILMFSVIDGEFLGYFAEGYSFESPFSIFFDGGDVFVTIPGIVKRFSRAGVFQNQFGSYGTGDGQFSGDVLLSFEPIAKKIYAVDMQGHRINIFSRNMEFLFSWGEYGSGHGQFIYPFNVAFDNTGYAYVSDWGNCRIQKFLLQGTPVVPLSWGGIKARFH